MSNLNNLENNESARLMQNIKENSIASNKSMTRQRKYNSRLDQKPLKFTNFFRDIFRKK